MNLSAEEITAAYALHGSRRAASRALGVPRRTYVRWLQDIEREGEPRLRGSATARNRVDTHNLNADVARGLFDPAPNRPQYANHERKHTQTRETVLFLYDIHLPNESQENISIALDYARTRHNISRVVLGGDLLDCAAIGRFHKDPTKVMPWREELEYARKWLNKLRARFKKQEIVYVCGNHEARLPRYIAENAPEMVGTGGETLPEKLGLASLGIRWVDNMGRLERGEGAYKIGKLNVLHGHELGICPAIDCARKYFMKAMENIIVGHVHKRDEHTEPTLGDIKGAWVCGHLQDEHPAYRPFNKWVAGFAIAHFDDDGLFSVKLKKLIEGRVL